MKKVITYGTFDLLHYGHLRLLERAKELGDYLIVGVTSDDFDRRRGKINVKQSLMERYKAVEETGLANEIIVEEYEGQKIDDIIKYGIDVFAIGSDWEGKFDYLKEYCNVIYLPRTQGISSTKIRAKKRAIRLGAVGYIELIYKYIEESKYVNGIDFTSLLTNDTIDKEYITKYNIKKVDSYDELLEDVDAVYISSLSEEHYDHIKKALENKKHVLCESPIVINTKEYEELLELANKNKVILMEAIKTKYSTAFSRLLLLAKSGSVGDIISVDCNCTSLKLMEEVGIERIVNYKNSISEWGPTALLPIFELLGTNYVDRNIVSWFSEKNKKFDFFTKIDFLYKNGIASMKVGRCAKSEGELVISGTKGYIYVPAPWWKTDYFEVRYENIEKNKRYFYQLEGEGIRYELIAFLKYIERGAKKSFIDNDISKAIVSLMEDFYNKNNVKEIIL